MGSQHVLAGWLAPRRRAASSCSLSDLTFFLFVFEWGLALRWLPWQKPTGGERESIATFLFFPAFDFSSRALCLTFSFLCIQHDQIVRVVDDDDDDRSGGFLVRLSDRD